MATRAKPEPDTRVQANPYLARQLAAGCNRYAELLTEQAESAAKSPAQTYDPERGGPQPIYADSYPLIVGALDLDSTRELASLFRQHARELLEPHRTRVE
jgi:hypothetical protein